MIKRKIMWIPRHAHIIKLEQYAIENNTIRALSLSSADEARRAKYSIIRIIVFEASNPIIKKYNIRKTNTIYSKKPQP